MKYFIHWSWWKTLLWLKLWYWVDDGVLWSFVVWNLLPILSGFTQIRLCLISRFFGFGLVGRYAVINAEASTAIPSGGRIKEHLHHFCSSCSHCPGDHKACGLWRSSCSNLPMAIIALSHHAIAAYVIFRDYHSFIKPQGYLGVCPQDDALVQSGPNRYLQFWRDYRLSNRW